MSTPHGVRVEIPTEDGLADAYVFRPPHASAPLPAVLFYMDAIGLRPAMHEMAGRLAAHGYYVLLPNLYHRAGVSAPFDAARVWTVPEMRDRVRALMTRFADNATVMRDTTAYLDFIAHPDQADTTAVGCVGYCMGGGLALTAAGTFGERIAAAASIHGGILAVADRSDSPHHRAAGIRGRVYVGVAEVDATFTPEQRALLESTLAAHRVRHAVELYPGVSHGFAVPDVAPYNRAAAEKQWDRVLGLFAEAVPRAARPALLASLPGA